MTPALFAEQVLRALHLPVTDNNVASLVAFQAQEGGHEHNGAWHNPLNTKRSMPGARDAHLKSKGIKAYASWRDGVAATAKTIAQPNMRAVHDALARSAPPAETLVAISQSPWGWYVVRDHVRIPLPYPTAKTLIAHPVALAAYGARTYRATGTPSIWPSWLPGLPALPSLPTFSSLGLPVWSAALIAASAAVLGAGALGPRHGRAGAAMGAAAGLGTWLLIARGLGQEISGPEA